MDIIQSRINSLRSEMQKLNLDAWYISGTDPHSSEYLPDRWQTRAFISGFTGSFGMIVVTKEETALWTDTRYFLQATDQLKGTGITMQKLRVPDAISPDEWLTKKLPSGSRVGIDAETISVQGFRNLYDTLFEKNIELIQTPDLLNNIWNDRPTYSSAEIYELKTEYAGVSRNEKQRQIAEVLKNKGADFHLITMLDELAWTFNLRGNDINFNPVFIGYGLVGEKENYLFVDKNKISQKLKLDLNSDGVQIKDYREIESFLTDLKQKTVFLDASSANYALYNTIKENNVVVEGTSVVSLLKARKNSTEIHGFKKAMKKDGVALIEFLYWLKNRIGKEKISEYDIGLKLKEFRAKQEGFKGESFPPIVGYKEHGAIVHLSVGKEDALPVKPEGILLFDSGGQYLEGTTDITRTVALGTTTAQQKLDFTIVLKGMIALTNARFPYGTKGCHLDILARRPLWERGMNYGHGTGHGVGHFLNVHEGPMAIRQEYNPNFVEPGQVLSNEPAFYREGQYGIRTENMMVCVEVEKTEFGQFLGFETLTLCPIDTTLIETELLSPKERNWLNFYHKKVQNELKPLLEKRYHRLLDDLTQEI